MAQPSNIEATDSETLAYLRNPTCGIPFDVHFEIEDEEGTCVGVVGGHRAVLALKSPVFKAMLYGAMAERGDVIKIKKTSVFAFKEMLVYMHDAKMDWRPWSIDTRELFRMADLAERYNLPGLSERVIDYAKKCLFPKEKLLEIASLAEGFNMFTELSEALLDNCAMFLATILETPEVHNNIVKEWSGLDAEIMVTAFRLLARVDRRKLTYVIDTGILMDKELSHIRHVWHSIQPRQRLRELKRSIQENASAWGRYIYYGQYDLRPDYDPESTVLHSLRICQMKDEEMAALEGVALTLDFLVEDGITHGESVKLHLDMISKPKFLEHLDMDEPPILLDKRCIDEICEIMLDKESLSIAGAKSTTLSWLSSNSEIMPTAYVAEKLRSCADNVKELPEYNNACALYDV